MCTLCGCRGGEFRSRRLISSHLIRAVQEVLEDNVARHTGRMLVSDLT